MGAGQLSLGESDEDAVEKLKGELITSDITRSSSML